MEGGGERKKKFFTYYLSSPTLLPQVASFSDLTKKVISVDTRDAGEKGKLWGIQTKDSVIPKKKRDKKRGGKTRITNDTNYTNAPLAKKNDGRRKRICVERKERKGCSASYCTYQSSFLEINFTLRLEDDVASKTVEEKMHFHNCGGKKFCTLSISIVPDIGS